ncbi:vancomycin resistance protein YoaR [Desulfitispora alkaliphila]|uniref:VanW family protein n=1 Tax=Desulfitispora alkaliphila TaxID=622674 RepID=UPI003D235050
MRKKVMKVAFVCILITTILFGGIKGANYVHRHYIDGVKAQVYLEGFNLQGYYRNEVKEIIEVLALEIERKPQNAGIVKETGEIVAGREGLVVNRRKTLKRIMNSTENVHHNLEVEKVMPEVTTEALEAVDYVLGSYATGVGGSANRMQNVIIAAKAISNTLVLPGEVFSFNETTGPRTVENGYKQAPVIIGGGFGMDAGGGVCQVSSTMYNAVLKSNLEIVERHPHSKPVRYVPKNRDAAVSWGSLDFKFKNSTDYPIIVKSSAVPGRVEVTIMGVKE